MSHAALITTLAAALLAGCASIEPEQARPSAPTCTAGPDCTAKWNAAQLWIAQKSRFKLVVATDVVLQTEGPSYVGYYAPFAATTVMREPDGPGRFRLVPSFSCGGFWCAPPLSETLDDFTRTVNAASAQ